MFVPITNSPRDYAWGSAGAISTLLGARASGRPEAELWLGSHPGSPSRILAPETVGGARDLAEWLERDPATALGGREGLPFLMKVLAASSPLSLQAHPTADQAREGFRRENALGIPIDAAHRNYRDEQPKPEVIVALRDGFGALCGFRPMAETAKVLDALGLAELIPRLDDLPKLFAWLLGGTLEVDELLARLDDASDAADADEDRGEDARGIVDDALDTVRRLRAAYPGDPGILCALLLNRVTLQEGQALYLPAGNIHAYLEGIGIEVMTASDNVLRGGLTPKHVDVPELLRVLDFTPGAPPWLKPERTVPGIDLYRPDVDDFILVHVTGGASLPLTGPAIALCVSGSMDLTGGLGSVTLGRGESVYITPDEGTVSLKGVGEVFLATTP